MHNFVLNLEKKWAQVDVSDQTKAISRTLRLFKDVKESEDICQPCIRENTVV